MIEVRKATRDDVSDLAQLNFEFNEVVVPSEHIIKSLDSSREMIAVAVFENQIIGFACAQYFNSFCYEGLYGEITELYVKEQFRRRGAAASIISFLEKELKSVGVKEIKIITNVKNEAAKSAYFKNGYNLENWVVLSKEYE